VIALARVAAPRDGPSTATRKLITGSGSDPSAFTEGATQITEDPLGPTGRSVATCSTTSPASASISRTPAGSMRPPTPGGFFGGMIGGLFRARNWCLKKVHLI